MALKRFQLLEWKLGANPRIRDLYCHFTSEYISFGHMTIMSVPGTYIIPHQAVYRPSENSPKIRVVFDASTKSFNGMSLNSCLLLGPIQQRDVE